MTTASTRFATSSPLVQHLSEGGGLVPAGRKFSDEPRADGLNCYALTDAEDVAFDMAIEELTAKAPLSPSTYTTTEEGLAMEAAGITSDTPRSDKDRWLTDYRTANPLPTSFHELPDGDPCKWVGEVIDPNAPAPTTETTSKPLDGSQPLTDNENAALKVATTPFHELPMGSTATVNADRTVTIAAPAILSDTVNVPITGILAEAFTPGAVIEVLSGGQLQVRMPHPANTHGMLEMVGELGQELQHLATEVSKITQAVQDNG